MPSQSVKSTKAADWLETRNREQLMLVRASYIVDQAEIAACQRKFRTSLGIWKKFLPMSSDNFMLDHSTSDQSRAASTVTQCCYRWSLQIPQYNPYFDIHKSCYYHFIINQNHHPSSL